jgi:hypothetical protein
MKGLKDLSREEKTKVAEAIQKDDIVAYKNIIGYDSMSQLEKTMWMVHYSDMVDTLNKINNSCSNKNDNIRTINDDDKNTLSFVRNVATRTLKRGI